MSETVSTIAAATDEPKPIAVNAVNPQPRSRRIWIFVCVTLLIAALALLFHHHGNSATAAEDLHLPAVAVAKVDRENLRRTLTVAAEFRPYEQVSLHAKVAGYLQSISVDVGDHVKEGQAIAQLDVPEIKNDLEKDLAAVRASEEEVARAQAAYDETHLSSDRLLGVAKEHPKLVAQQDVDAAQAKDRSAAGALAVAKQHVDEASAQLHKTQTELGFATIVAPFDGVITRRYADPGALIQAGISSNTQTMPLVDIDEDSRLRLVFPVPESAVAQVKIGAPVQVTISALKETFNGTVSRFSGKVDRATRTMLTEVDVENSAGRYKPGMYADATLILQEKNNVVAAPVEAISVGEHPSVLVVEQNGTVQNRAVKLGLQTPNRDEVLEGLRPGDLVIVGSRAGIQAGQKVAAKPIATTAAE
jgi:RND family efflux transporter MFP subunit